jgi:hypothetical protein
MCIDKTGQYNHPLPVDDSRRCRLDAFSNCDDLTILDVNVAAGNIAEPRIHRHDIRIPEK